MTPKEIITKHISKIPGIRVRDVVKAVDAAMKDISEYDYVIVERRDLLKEPELLRALYCNRATQNISH